uniref:Mago nashi protein n=1 Tax=Amorphochlora amoebiformis TaxID=1561963 RepID=A0A0H5BLV4_9EUKA|nr:Mago nashi protein [Amorphochlora amoebiformis]
MVSNFFLRIVSKQEGNSTKEIEEITIHNNKVSYINISNFPNNVSIKRTFFISNQLVDQIISLIYELEIYKSKTFELYQINQDCFQILELCVGKVHIVNKYSKISNNHAFLSLKDPEIFRNTNEFSNNIRYFLRRLLKINYQYD